MPIFFQPRTYIFMAFMVLIACPVMAAEKKVSGHRRTGSGLFRRLAFLKNTRQTRSAEELLTRYEKPGTLAGSKNSRLVNSAPEIPDVIVGEIYLNSKSESSGSDDSASSSEETSGDASALDPGAFAEREMDRAQRELDTSIARASSCALLGDRLRWERLQKSSQARLELAKRLRDVAAEQDHADTQKIRAERQNKETQRLLAHWFEELRKEQACVTDFRLASIEAEVERVALEEQINGYLDGFPGLIERLEMASEAYEQAIAEQD